MSLVAKPATSTKPASVAKGRSKAAQLLSHSGSRRISKKRKVVPFEPSPSRCATNGSDVDGQETDNTYTYMDGVVGEAFALAETQKKLKHERARCISDEQGEWDAHDGHLDYGDAQGATDDEQ